MKSLEKTLKYYNENAQQFKADTINVEFEEKRNILLNYLKNGNKILDLGCGSGRDSKAFIEKGYKVVAIDGSEEICKIASKEIGSKAICQKFSEIDYNQEFDGVWACASLLHVEYEELSNVFAKVIKAMKIDGYFYASFKYGEFEGYRNERYFTDFTKIKFEEFIEQFSNLKVVKFKITGDARVGRENEKWLNIIMQKVK
ncbi:MAG: class I SAM-dependent methyltransferase [Sarcina sp.]